jgi:exodeoxyribonuclease V alpha subunit
MTIAVQLSALDHHFAEFITGLDRRPGTELWLAAALASAASGQGNTCLTLAEYAENAVLPFRQTAEPLRAPDLERWLAALSSCSTIGSPGSYTPLVLDASGRLYLHRSWEHERQVGDSILARVAPLPVDRERLAAGLARYFPPQSGTFDWQRAAGVAAVSRRLTVITGGPGTGKTSTVARILALLIDQCEGRELRISLAAPTGKAAMRLRHSILQAVGRLDLSAAVQAQFPDQVQTIHRLLGVIPDDGGFRHNRHNPLSCDLLVVDEVSMVDLPLMARLLEALPDQARLILLGDRDQLASVEAGAVLADICNHGRVPPFSREFRELVEDTCGPLPPDQTVERQLPAAPLADAVIHLRTSYRFSAESGISALSSLITSGDAAAALELLTSGAHSDLTWRTLPDAGDFDAALSAAVRDGYGTYASTVTPGPALEELEHFRILSPHRGGICGVDNLNRLAENALELRRPAGQPWCRLLAVMVSGNNYELGLFNGDTAVLMDDPHNGRLTAYFPDPEGGLRRLSPLRLPPCNPAFALTVHKSQGSEFNRILLILPERDSEMLTRELIFTAVSRARTHVEIWGTEEGFCRAVERRIRRSSGLKDLLWGAGNNE